MRNLNVTIRDVQDIRQACELLKQAKANLRRAGALNARAYVARASKSAEGALRHAERMERRSR